jgi:hypothetical protein
VVDGSGGFGPWSVGDEPWSKEKPCFGAPLSSDDGPWRRVLGA